MMDFDENNNESMGTHAKPVLWLLLLFSLVFSAAGFWIVSDASNSYDRLMGAGAFFCFGASACTLGYKIKKSSSQ